MRHSRSKAPLLPPVTELPRLVEGNSSRPASPTTRIASLQASHEQCRDELYHAIEDGKRGLIGTQEKMQRMQKCRKEMASLAERRREVERDLKDVGLEHMFPIERSDELVKKIGGVSARLRFGLCFCDRLSP
jgi:seryl-tRNA synthetase